jgi:RNA polymerase sigma factor (TIGR02999 family)
VPDPDLTALLSDLRSGDADAVDAILPLVYDELQVLARRQLRSERDGHTLDTAALVHEAYLKLVRQESVDWQNRAHFFGIASLAMRRILVNYAAARKAEKRGGGAAAVTYHDGDVGRTARIDDLLDLDAALTTLAERSERAARVVEMWFFGGLTHEEIAEALGISEPTVRRDWRMARAWLSHVLRDESPAP